MSTPKAARLARRLFGSVRGERPSDELRARILSQGRAELERARTRPVPAPDEVPELASTRRQRTRVRRWMAAAAFAAAAAGLVASMDAMRPRDHNVLISAERTQAHPPPSSTQPNKPTPTPIQTPIQTPIRIPTQTPAPTPTPIRIPTQTPAPTPTPIRIPTQTPIPNPTHSLGEQLEQIKRARAALRAGDHQRALQLIDAYLASPTGGELGAEASVLRIEALAQSGQRDAAAREARQFASDYPNSPLIDRALSFVGGAER
jgi:hypothetical protein